MRYVFQIFQSNVKGLLQGRAVVRFSNTGDQIVIDCIFVFLFPFLTPQIPKGAGVGGGRG